MADELWSKLDKAAKLLATVMARTYLERGTTEFAVADLSRLTGIRPQMAAELLTELVRRDFGTLAGDQTSPKFVINRPRFEDLGQRIGLINQRGHSSAQGDQAY